MRIDMVVNSRRDVLPTTAIRLERGPGATSAIRTSRVTTTDVRRCTALLAVLVATPAAADRTTTSVTASGDVSATDNVFAAPREIRESDVSFAIRPGVLFGYDGPRASHELALEGEVLEFARHSDEPSVSIRGGARTRIQTTRFTSLSAQLEGSNGVLTALAARSSPDVTGPQLVPLGRIDTITGSGAVSLSIDTGRDMQITPSVFGRFSRSDDNAVDAAGTDTATITTSQEYGASLGAERSWRDNAVGVEIGVTLLNLERDAAPTAALGSRLDRQLNPRLRAQWRHDWSRRWSTTIDGGGVLVHPLVVEEMNNPDATVADGIFPVFGAGVAYTEVWGRAQAQVRREVAPNLLVAQNTVNDQASINLALPLPWLDDSRRRAPKLIALGSIGAARTQLIDSETGDAVGGSFLVGNVDVGLGYSPRPGFTYGLRYTFQYQTGDDAAEMVVPGFWRNTLSFTFQLRYPDRAAGEEARRRSRGGVRADGGDLVPIGVEPAGGAELSTDGGGDGGGDE